jgi:SAM-dependent methyltransferase
MTFEVAADAYDRFMGVWSRGLAPQIADFAGISAGQRVLDVGCGPGSLTAELVARLGAEAVAAVDPSESFVAAARARYPGVDVRQATAEALPFANATFDAALAQLVVHFMTDPVAGVREMARVTRPGGLVAACVWDFGGGRGPLGPFWREARAIDPTVEDESERAGTHAGQLKTLFVAAGLTSVAEATLEVKRDYAGFDDWWEPFNQGVGPAGGHVAKMDEARRIELRERCRGALPSGAFILTAYAWAARGVR